ncbi:MAG: SGNH/GDSL hydrolase family protein [Roseateles sp.]
MKKFKISMLSLALLALAGCGGGGDDAIPVDDSVSSVKVFGDSLADVGTFGIRFTVQTGEASTFPERVAAAYGLSGQCNYYAFTGSTFTLNSKAGCTNYAVGGGVINNSNPADPRGIPLQLVAANGFKPNDLLLIDGGGNDAANLVTAYLSVPKDKGDAYAKLLGTLLPSAQVGTALAGGASSIAAIGVPYMQALAQKFASSIKDQALDKGARRVALLNMPGITNTPRFQTVLDSIAAASGGGTAGATARAQSEALFKSWVEAYNAELAKQFNGQDKVVIVDFYTTFNQQMATPAQFGLSNVKTPACPVKGVGSDGLPSYDFPTCTAPALSATPPAGVSGGADWWKTYLFSDGFHPTPLGHQQIASAITTALKAKGWLK